MPDADIRAGFLPGSQYEVKKRLHKGSISDVFQVIDRQTGREMAVKTISHRHQAGPEFDEWFLRLHREALVLSRLQDHPHIVQFIGVGLLKDGFFLATEYIDGYSLEELLGCRHALPVNEAARIAVDVLKGLEAVHRLKIVHRDLKPSNIMMSHAGDVRLIDFGVASLSVSHRLKKLTDEGASVGTPAYMAPEVCRRELAELGPSVDIYGLGLVLYELLTGCRPFPFVGDRVGAMIQQLSAPVIPFEQAIPGVKIPNVIQRIVYCALEKKPEKRFRSAREMRRVITAAMR